MANGKKHEQQGNTQRKGEGSATWQRSNKETPIAAGRYLI